MRRRGARGDCAQHEKATGGGLEVRCAGGQRIAIAECGRVGSIAASEVISHFGARPEADLRALVADAGQP